MSAISNDLLAHVNSGLGLRDAKSMSGDGSQWQREMERAQMTSWFGAMSQPEGKLRGQGTFFGMGSMHLSANIVTKMAEEENPPVDTRRMELGAPEKETSLLKSVESRNAVEGAIKTSEFDSPVNMRLPDSKTIANVFESNSVSSFSKNQVTESPSRINELRRVATTILPDVRLHAEWSGMDVSIWLGMNPHAEDIQQKILALLSMLQKILHSQRERLISVVCNGHEIFSNKSKMNDFAKNFEKIALEPERNTLFSDFCIDTDIWVA